jgi:hypothetical protein
MNSALPTPTPDTILAARLRAELSQREAAQLVHRHLNDPPTRCDRWSEWETGRRPMPVCEWELFVLKAFPHNPGVRAKFLKGAM